MSTRESKSSGTPAAAISPLFRRAPWTGRATRADKSLMVVVLAAVAFEFVLKPVTPFLIASHPVLFAFLSGDLTSIGAAAAFARIGEASLGVVVLAGAAGMAKFDWIVWWAGRRWGSGMVDMFTFGERGRRVASRATQLNPWILRSLVVLAALPGFPTAVIYAVAGWAGMRLRTFLLVDAIGTVLTTALVTGLGYSLGRHAVDVVLLVDEYASTVSLAVLSLTLVPPLVRWLRRRRGA